MRIILPPIRGRRGARAATLVELMISLLVFGLLVMALVYMNLFCLKQDELVNSKLGANDSSRLNFDLLQLEIRASKNVLIGFGSYSNFTSLTNGAQQSGDTLMIIPSTNLSVYIYYYFATNNGIPELCRMDSGGNFNVVATYLTNMVTPWQTNGMIFQATDYTGTNILTVSPTNYTHNYVVSILLQFSQYQYPQTIVGSNYFFNYYQIIFNATRRSP